MFIQTADLERTDVATLTTRESIVKWYAERWPDVSDNETLRDYTQQIAADWKDPQMEIEVRRAIRRLNANL